MAPDGLLRKLWRLALGLVCGGVAGGVQLSLLLTLLLSTLVGLLSTDPGLEWARRLALDQARPMLPGLSVRRITGSIIKELVLEGVVLKDRFGGEAIRLERLLLRYDLAALLDRSVRVVRVEVDRPGVVAKMAQNGRLNLAELVVPSDDEQEPPSGPLSWTVSLTTLKISNGAARYEAPTGERYEVEDLDLHAGLGLDLADNSVSLSLTSLGGRASIPGQPALELLLQGSGAHGRDRVLARTRVQLTTRKPTKKKSAGKVPGDAKPLLPVTIAAGQKITLELKAKGPLSHLDLDLSALLPGRGMVDLSGWGGLDLDGPAPVKKYEAKLKLARLNPKPLVPELISTEINLGLVVSGSGIPLQPRSSVALSVDLAPSSVMQYHLERLKVKGGLEGEAWSLSELALEAYGAQLRLNGRGTLKKIVNSRIKLKVPSLARLLLPPSVPPLVGAASADLTIKGPFIRDLSVKGEVTARGVAVDALRLGSARVTMDLQNLPQNPRGQATLSASRLLSIKGNKRTLLLSSGAVVISGTRQRLKVTADARRPDLRAGLTFSASLSPELPPKKITTRLLRLEAHHKKLHARLLNRPRVHLHLGQQVRLEPLRIQALGGELRARATYRFAAQPRLEARLQAIKIRPIKGPPVSADLSARLGRRDLVAKLLADLGSTVTLQARVPVRYRKNVPAPEPARPLTLRLRAPALDLGLVNKFLPSAPALGGTVSLDLQGSGSLRAPRLNLMLALQGVSSPYLSPLSGTARVEMGKKESTVQLNLTHNKRPLVILQGGAALTVARLIRSSKNLMRSLSKVPARAKLTVHTTPLPALGVIYPLLAEASGTVAASLELSGSLQAPRARARMLIRDGQVAKQKLGTIQAEMQLKGGGPRTTGKASIRLGKLKVVEIDSLVMSSVMDILTQKNITTLPIQIEAVFPRISLSALKDYHRLLQMTEGTFAGKASIKGSISAPQAGAWLSLQETRLNRQLLGDLTTRVSFDGRLFGLKLQLKQGRRGHVRAGLWLDLKERKGMSAFFDAGHLNIGFISELVPALRELDGKLQGNIKVTGGLKNPKIKGQLQLQGARVRVSGAPTLEKVDARLGLSQDRVRLVSLLARSGRGLITATGRVDLKDLRPTTFRLDARSTLFDLGVGPLKDSAFFGNLSVDGELAGSTLAANVRLSNGSLKMAGLGGDRTLHSTKPLTDVVFEQEQDRRKGRVKEAPPKPSKPLKLEIKAVVEPLRIRSDDFDLEAETNVRAKTDPRGKLRLHGWASLRKGGTLKVMGARYTVERAKVRFTGKPEPDPTLDVLLSRHIQTIMVLIGVGGSARAHKLSFKSDPPNYTEAQILNMIATGRVEEAASEMDGDTGGAEQKTGQKMTMANALTNALIGTFAGKAVSTVGLDVARLNIKEQEDEDAEVPLQAQAEVGKYLTREIYVGYRRIFGATDDENKNEGLLDYTFLPRWLLSLYFGDAGVGGVDVFWTFRY